MKIDLHVHTSETSGCGKVPGAEMARLFHQAGYDAITITDHLIAGKNMETPVKARVAWYLSGYHAARAEGEKLGLTVLLGAEVLAFEGIDRLPDLKKLRLQGTKLLLLEMPFNRWSEGLLDSVEAISDDEDFRIVLAHVDRYDRKAVEQLFRLNHVKGQVNADNLKRRFGMRYLREWAREGLIVAVGSDIHGTETGYVDWLTCQRRYAEDWAAIMKRTNRRLGPLLETASKQEAEANGARP